VVNTEEMQNRGLEVAYVHGIADEL
jgi:hypothetical protein